MVHRAAATGFARGVEAYERARPEYPPEAIAYLARELDLRADRVVVDLAAGSGKLTRPLARLGCEVIAIEPVDEMRAAIGGAARALAGTADRWRARSCTRPSARSWRPTVAMRLRTAAARGATRSRGAS